MNTLSFECGQKNGVIVTESSKVGLISTFNIDNALRVLKALGNMFLNDHLKYNGYKVDIFESEFCLDELCRNIHHNIPLDYVDFCFNGLDKECKEFGQNGVMLNVYDGSYTLSILGYFNGHLVTGLNAHLDAYFPNDIETDERS
jgi:hypothetical protein